MSGSAGYICEHTHTVLPQELAYRNVLGVEEAGVTSVRRGYGETQPDAWRVAEHPKLGLPGCRPCFL